MARGRQITIEFLGNARDLNRAVDSAERSTGKMGQSLKKIGAAAALGLAGVAAGFAAWGASSVKSLARIERINAQTAQAIKSTGGAAGVSAKHVEDLAGKLEGLTASEAEATQEGANLLLTFTNIKNEAGKGNKIFDQTTGIMVDMSRALGQDTKSSAIQLGKALNDPVKGVTALQRVGVSFTAQQKDTIKSLVESGDTMGAQKLILRELTKEFGGSGKAFAKTTEGQIELAKHAFGTLGETIFAAVLPPLARLATAATKGLTVLDKYVPLIKTKLAPALDFVRDLFDRFGNDGPSALDRIRDAFAPVVSAFRNAHRVVAPIIRDIVAMIRENWGPIKAWVKENFGQVRLIIRDVLKIVATHIRNVTAVIKFIWKRWGNDILAVAKIVFKTLGRVIGGALKVIRGIVTVVLAVMRGDWKKAWHGIKLIVSGVFDIIKALVRGNMALTKKIASVALREIAGLFKKLFEVTILASVRAGVRGIRRIWNGLKKAASDPVDFVVNTVYNNGIRKVVNAIPGVDNIPEVHFARGGGVFGGQRGKDSVRALLMPGEHVLTSEEVEKAGGHRVILALRKMLREGRAREFDLPAFANGGPIGFMRASAFATSQSGKPYQWGGVGPSGYDCSGFMSAITNVMRGRSPYSRVGSTASFPWSGFKPGVGQFTIGSTPNYGGSGIGHMAGTLGLVNVESAGGVGVRIGRSARGYNDRGFSQVGHIGASGRGAQQAGSFWGAVKAIKSIAGKFSGWFKQLAGMGGWGGLVRDMARSVSGSLRNWVNDKVPGPGPFPDIFDRGGLWRGGLAYNGTGRAERVLTPRQTSAFEHLVGNLGGQAVSARGGAELHIHFHGVIDSTAAGRELEKVLVQYGRTVRRPLAFKATPA